MKSPFFIQIENKVVKVLTTVSPFKPVDMETRLLDRSGPNYNAAIMVIQIKFDCSWPAGCGDIHV